MKNVIFTINVSNTFFQIRFPFILDSLYFVIQTQHNLPFLITIFVVGLVAFQIIV
ncbi:Uncharacterised protein [Mycobacteroides abscessus subsp. abscessus]|nr:Uncharacterised protein [Mycobacteroides abscessus subsp. abscessus]